MDEIFSISPTGEELCDFDPTKDDIGSEFDSDDDRHGINSKRAHIIEDDDDEDDDDNDIHGLHTRNSHLVRFGL